MYSILRHEGTVRLLTCREKQSCGAFLSRTRNHHEGHVMRVRKTILATCVGAAVLGSCAARVCSQSAPPSSGTPVPTTAEQSYKNIQVLNGFPADQLMPSMQFMTASLGVQCDFCHLENAFEKDDKETKQTAPRMIRMMFAINKDNFNGHREVTSYSCHRRPNKPTITPIISQEAGNVVEEKMNHQEPTTASLPAADLILLNYLQQIS